MRRLTNGGRVTAIVFKTTIKASLASARTRPADFVLKLILNVVASGLVLYLFRGIVELGGMSAEERAGSQLFILLLLSVDGIFQVLFGSSIHTLGRFVKEGRLDGFFLRPHLSPLLLLVREVNLAALPGAVLFLAMFAGAAIEASGIEFAPRLVGMVFACSLAYLAIACVALVVPVLLGIGTEAARGFYFATMRISQTPHEILVRAAPTLSLLLIPYFAVASLPLHYLHSDRWLLVFAAVTGCSALAVWASLTAACAVMLRRAA
jgi:ABC-type uncharacterized transport system permease subunit